MFLKMGDGGAYSFCASHWRSVDDIHSLTKANDSWSLFYGCLNGLGTSGFGGRDFL